ncbi:peroxidase 7-like [Impatiens glandulifera]|uniref:peroxidase 7-like n=1 Tax=Impatiens glandulifera TaxID=253017 RepID=UPI001FB0FB63|nr:peroxidase 7-like [Impatiens glandulifera]
MGYNNNLSCPWARGLMIVVLVAGLIPLGSCDLGDDVTPYDDALTFSYYHGNCPNFEGIVHNKIKQWINKDYTLAASIIRLHFHDCSVRGCDASILLDHEGSERRANASKTLRGYEVIDDIKAAIEKKCPKTISCADILTAAARDATVAVGGPFWMVPYGRKDGKVSLAKEASLVPAGKERITDLLHFFQSKGLNVLDLVTLSGAHTIGKSACGAVQHRLYNYKGTGKPDPTIAPKYLNYLRRKCRWASEGVDLDATTPKTFDNVYYTNLQKKMGLLSTDQGLYYDSRTSHLVTAMASQPHVFQHQFAASMVKLGNIIDYDNDEGEVRLKCSSVNAKKY